VSARASRRASSEPRSGALVVDKPTGPTSHDVVALARRALGTREVGHAGTLDPMASGVLVLLVGEATKLVPYATAAEKTYVATITLGRATDTHDALGATTAERPLPSWLEDELARALRGAPAPRLEEALARTAAREEQVPPAFSALHVDGERAHERARRGEVLTLPARRVGVRRLSLVGVEGASVTVELTVDKGFYVRSFARDLGDALLVPAHLSALRRTASGVFALDRAAPWPLDASSVERVWLGLEEAALAVLPALDTDSEGAKRVRLGQRLRLDGAWRRAPRHVGPAPSTRLEGPEPSTRLEGALASSAAALVGPHALFDPEGALVAIVEPQRPEGEAIGQGLAILRGFRAKG
jgi:tRNA pseudouridine55 synthase